MVGRWVFFLPGWNEDAILDVLFIDSETICHAPVTSCMREELLRSLHTDQ
jgi:hypothetical protein